MAYEIIELVQIDFDTGTEYFIKQDVNFPLEINAIPCLTNIDYAAATINPFKGFGYIGEVSLTFANFNYPYGNKKGTYFGRLRASNKYYLDRKVTIYKGNRKDFTIGLELLDKQVYFLDEFGFPNSVSTITLKARDIIKKLDSKRALAPLESSATLVNQLLGGVTGSIKVTSIENFKVKGVAVIDGKEFVRYTSSPQFFNDTLTITERGLFRSSTVTHEPNVSIRPVFEFDNINAVDAIRNLLTSDAGISSSYIDNAEWDYERDNYLDEVNLLGAIKEPTEIKKTIEKICEMAFINIWWDVENQKVRIRANRREPPLVTIPTITTENEIIEQTHTVNHTLKEYMTQVWVYYDRIDFTDKPTDATNYRRVAIVASPELEAEDKYQSKSVKKIFAEFFGSDSGVSAFRTARRYFDMYKDGVFTIAFSLDISKRVLSTGNLFKLYSENIEDKNGDISTVIAQVVKKVDSFNRINIEAIQLPFSANDRQFYIAPNDTPNYESATEIQRLAYGFICDDNGLMSDNSDGYKIV